MFSLLAKRFIKNSSDYTSPDVCRSYGMLSGIFGIFLNIVLFAIKFLAGTLSGSIAITADAINNLSDAGSSLITFFGFKFAGMKADKDHPFGHGRIEYIAGLSISVIVIVMGIELGKSSIEKIISPSPVDSGLLPIIILAVSIIIKLYMFIYNRSYGKKINSSSMRATATDSLSDAASTSVVLISILISKAFSVNIDGWCGILVALLVLYAGYSSGKDTLTSLIGAPPEKEFVKDIKDITMSYDDVVGIHDLVVHDYGMGRRIISLHAEVPCTIDMLVIHDVIDRIEKELSDKLNCEAVIHMDPIDVNNELVSNTREQLIPIVKSVNEKLTIHDFRMVSGTTHTNLIFDVVAPFDCTLNDEQIVLEIQERVREKWPTYNCVIKIDKLYI